MSVPAPHFLLHARANRTERSGRWSFNLESKDGSHSMKIEDAEPGCAGDRLELLALVRGLEALPQPAEVTVLTTSPYVVRILTGGLDEWRANDWRWEHHGEMVPVKNADLWRRVDRALTFHRVQLGRVPSHLTQETCRATMPECNTSQPVVADGAHRALSPCSTIRPRWRPLPRRQSVARKTLAATVLLCHVMRRICRRICEALETTAADASA